jgi:hypothetical protein
MASVRALAIRRGEVEAKLATLAERVNARLATPLAEPAYSKVPEIAVLQRLEWLATLIEAQTTLQETPTMDEQSELAAARKQLDETTQVADDATEQVQEQEAEADASNEVRPAAPRESEPAPAPAAPELPGAAGQPGAAPAPAGPRYPHSAPVASGPSNMEVPPRKGGRK